MQDRILSVQVSRRVSRTGYVTAFARALSRRSDPPEIANGDHLADAFLLPFHRIMNRVPRLTRKLFDRLVPGAVAYFNARTRHFDAIVSQQIDAGIDQLVVLGAGFDSRAMRFDARLGDVRVFEVDVADVLALKLRHLAATGRELPPRVVQVAIDFSTEPLGKLSAYGFRSDVRTLFLWEGVAMYLRDEDVSGVLQFVRDHSRPGSTLAFDYVTARSSTGTTRATEPANSRGGGGAWGTSTDRPSLRCTSDWLPSAWRSSPTSAPPSWSSAFRVRRGIRLVVSGARPGSPTSGMRPRREGGDQGGRSAIATREEVLRAGLEGLGPGYVELERVSQPVRRVEGEGDGERVLDLRA